MTQKKLISRLIGRHKTKADKKALEKQFFENTDLTLKEAVEIVQAGLQGADFGEFFQEVTDKETLVKDKGTYVTVSLGSSESGFGFRVGQGEKVGYRFSSVFNKAALKGAIEEARKVLDPNKKPSTHKKKYGAAAPQLYTAENPIKTQLPEEKIAKMDAIENYIKSLDPRITNVTLSYKAQSQAVHIITPDGQSLMDVRPLATMSIAVQLTDKDGNTETGSAIIGGKGNCHDVFDPKIYKEAAKKALKQADTLLIAEDAPAGVMDVVLSPGWSAIILHEAIGHGLEGDFNRKGISVYSGKIGQKIAGDEVTIIDQGDLPGERGSLQFDDEGAPTQQNVLVEKGVLKKYMQDQQNAQLMGVDPTGNGRRESYAHAPMPRMTNTYFANGTHDPEDIIKSVKDGLYISDFSNGQVDIVSGKFNMNATLAYRIRDGKICEAVKGATLTGDGLTVLQSITMVGNDLDIEKSAGVCGKNGQSVVVSCGQPTIRVSNLLVGGNKR